MMNIRLHLKIAGPVEQTLCPGVKCSRARMQRTTAHSDLHKRSSQAAEWPSRLELALIASRPLQQISCACVVLLPDHLERLQRSVLRVALA